MSIVEVNGLEKAYKNVKAVDGISFTVEKGEIFGLLGHNGAGKTTTIECMIGLKPFEKGSISVCGINPLTDRQALYSKIGAQLQETSYQDKIRVSEICQFFATLYPKPYPYEKLLESFDLKEKKNAYVDKLSGGQRQKLSIILALISNPEIVFLDELTTGLDPEARRSMWKYIKALKAEGRTIFMTTHYMEEAEFLCDRIGIMNSGKLIALDTVENVINQSGIDYEISFHSNDSNIATLLESLGHIRHVDQKGPLYTIYTPHEKTLGKLVYQMETQNIDYGRVSIKNPSLDDVFIKYTTTKKEA